MSPRDDAVKWLRALACDDEASLCDLMARRVEMLGLQVDTTQGGQAGPALIGSDKYDLVASDTYEVGRGTGFTVRPPVCSQTLVPSKV